MRRNQNSVVLWAALVLPIIWLGALAAQCCGENINLIGWLDGLSAVMQNPFALRWTPYTPRCILGALVLYGLAISAYVLIPMVGGVIGFYISDLANKLVGEGYTCDDYDQE